MPLFAFRLEAVDSEHFRRGVCEFESKAEARAELERREVERAVAFTLNPDELAELTAEELRLGFDGLPGRDRARLALHRQTKPYRLVQLDRVRGT